MKGNHEMCKTLLYSCSSNVMSVTGSNLKNFEIEAYERIQLEELHISIVRACEILEFEAVPESKIWRIPAMKEAALS